MGAVRGYKINFELKGWDDASTCWCKEKSSTVRCGDWTILGWSVSLAFYHPHSRRNAVRCPYHPRPPEDGRDPRLDPYSPEKQFHVKNPGRDCLRDVELITSALSSVFAIFHEEDGREDFSLLGGPLK